MDTDMSDVVKVAEHHLSLAEPGAISTLDSWIDSLMNCKQLAENDVQRLCDKVRKRSASPEELGRVVYEATANEVHA